VGNAFFIKKKKKKGSVLLADISVSIVYLRSDYWRIFGPALMGHLITGGFINQYYWLNHYWRIKSASINWLNFLFYIIDGFFCQ